MRKIPIEQKLQSRIEKTATCWLWTGLKCHDGYGRLSSGYLAHRVAYETWVGPIPTGLEIDHLCRVRHCVNPDHLEAVTREENQRRVPRPTHCPSGHPYSPENTVISARRGRQERICRRCLNDRQKRRYHAKKASTERSA